MITIDFYSQIHNWRHHSQSLWSHKPSWRRKVPHCRQDWVRCLAQCGSWIPCGLCPSAIHTCPPRRTCRPSCQRGTGRRWPGNHRRRDSHGITSRPAERNYCKVWLIDWVKVVHPLDTNGSFRRRLSQPISWCTTTTTPQPFYGPFSRTIRVSRCKKRTSGLYGARED